MAIGVRGVEPEHAIRFVSNCFGPLSDMPASRDVKPALLIKRRRNRSLHERRRGDQLDLEAVGTVRRSGFEI